MSSNTKIAEALAYHMWSAIFLTLLAVTAVGGSDCKMESLEKRKGIIGMSVTMKTDFCKEWKILNHHQSTLVVTVEKINLKFKQWNKKFLLGDLSIAGFPITTIESGRRIAVLPFRNFTTSQDVILSMHVDGIIYQTSGLNYTSVNFVAPERRISGPVPSFKLKYEYVLNKVLQPAIFTTALDKNDATSTIAYSKSTQKQLPKVVGASSERNPSVDQLATVIAFAGLEGVLLLIAAVYVWKIRRFDARKPDNFSMTANSTFEPSHIYEEASEVSSHERTINTVSSKPDVVHNELYNIIM